MRRPQIVDLPPELDELRRRLEDSPRSERDDLYRREFAPRFARLFAELPLHSAPKDFPRPRALVSLLGFSWQPVALMAAWARPEKMLILGTEESLHRSVGGVGVVTLIADTAGLDRSSIRTMAAADPIERHIYLAVRDFLRDCRVPRRRVFVDPTGGKKSMSTAAALAAFIAGAPLVYVDYSEFVGDRRAPRIGSEYPRLLVNPLEVLGDLEHRRIFDAFNQGNFSEAERLAEDLASRLYEPREAECLACLAEAYGAWDRFDFANAGSKLHEARDLIERWGDRGPWRWALALGEQIDRNLSVLSQLAATPERPASIEEGRLLLVWYLAKAGRTLAAGRPSQAVLLIYAALERYITLCLSVDFGLVPESPSYAAILPRVDVRRFNAAGAKLFRDYQPRDRITEENLPAPIMLMRGAQLLYALSPNRLEAGDLGPLTGLSRVRNRCEFEHGFLPQRADRATVEGFLGRARAIIGRLFDGVSDVDRLYHCCSFPRLGGAGAAERDHE